MAQRVLAWASVAQSTTNVCRQSIKGLQNKVSTCRRQLLQVPTVEDDPQGPPSQEALEATESLEAGFDPDERLDYNQDVRGQQWDEVEDDANIQRGNARLRDQHDGVRSERGSKVLDDYYERYASYAGVEPQTLWSIYHSCYAFQLGVYQQ
jgi:hypothetical protein